MSSRAPLIGLVAIATAAGFGGCNAILDNQPAELVRTDGGGAEADLPDVGPLADVTSPGLDGRGDDRTGRDGDGAIAPPPPTCPAGTKPCGGACAAIGDPAFGCGSASCSPCALAHATATCKGDRCAVLKCSPGYADCDAVAATGCEASLAAPTSCGSCATVCPAPTSLCTPQGDTYRCIGGCPPATPVACGAECIDPATSLAHCGECNQPCAGVANGTSACVGGACTFACAPGFHACGARCVSANDPDACGPTCAVCPDLPGTTRSCAGGGCGAVCTNRRGDCDLVIINGCETDLESDPLHCGACGNVCPSGVCRDGACRPGP